MKKFLSIFFSFLFAFQAHAGFVLERIDGTIWDQVERLRVPNNQITKLGDKRYLFETGSDNTIKDPGVEGINLQWVKYADAALSVPVDGTGGTTSNLTCESTTSTPLAGNKSLLISKVSGVSAQGSGCSIDFTINRADRANMIKVEFDYEVASGAFAAGTQTSDSDVVVYIYDVTNNKIVNFSGAPGRLYSFVDRFRGYFQASPDSVNYRLILHTATGSTSAWSVKFDSFSTSRSAITVGTIITDGVSYNPTISTASGTISNYTVDAKWMRVGQNIKIQGVIKFTGTPSGSPWSVIFISPPSGLTFDIVNFDRLAIPAQFRVGIIGGQPTMVSTSIAANGLMVIQYGNTIGASSPFKLSSSNFDNTTGITNNDNAMFAIEAPIVGWSAGARMSDGYDGAPLYLKVQANNTASPLTLTTTLQPIPFQTVVRDPLGCFNTTTGVCTVPRSSFYCAAGNASFLITGTMPGVGTEIARLELTVGNSGQIDQWFSNGASTTGGNQKLAVTACNYLTAGQTISLRARKDTSVSAATGTISQYADGNNLSVWDALQGYSIMSPTALWETHYAGTAGDAIGTTDSLIKFTTKVEDTFGSYNPATGLWTAKGPATCSADARIQGSSVNMSTTQSFGSALRKDGAAINNGTIMYGAGVSRVPSSIISASSIKVVQGTTLSVYAYSDVATTASTSQTSNYFTVSCRQSGN